MLGFVACKPSFRAVEHAIHSGFYDVMEFICVWFRLFDHWSLIISFAFFFHNLKGSL